MYFENEYVAVSQPIKNLLTFLSGVKALVENVKQYNGVLRSYLSK